MNRRRTYVWTLIVFFLMWGVFGFVAAGSRSEPAGQVAAPAVGNFSSQSNAERNVGIPVTGEGQPQPRITLAQVLFGFIVVFGVLALLNTANRSATTYVRHEDPPDKH